jgi:hypothetical protein
MQHFAIWHNSGLNSDSLSICFEACQIFLKIVKVLKHFDILNPVVTFLDSESQESDSLDSDEFRILWGMISEIVSFQVTPIETILQFFSIAINLLDNQVLTLDRRTAVLDSFLPVISIIQPEFAAVLINLSLDLSLAQISSTNSLPDLSVVTKAITTRSQTEIVTHVQQKIPKLLGAGDIPCAVLAVSLLGPLLQFAQVSMSSEVTFVREVLTQALTTPHELVQRAALRVCNIMDDSSSGYVSLLVDLIKLVMNLFTVDSQQVRGEAFHAFLTHCERIDSEVDGLFEALWQSQGDVGQTEMDQYIQAIGAVLRHSEKLSDEQIGRIIGFLDTISKMDVPERAAGLNIIIELLPQREGLFETLMPRVGDILEEALAYENEDVTCQALAFVQNLVKTFGEASLPLVIPTFEFFGGILEDDPDTRLFRVALRTVATTIKFTGDVTLLEAALAACLRMLESKVIETKVGACENVALIAKVVPVNLGIVTTIANVVEIEMETELITAALEAMSKLLKGHTEYVDISQRLIENFFSGNIKYLHGSVELLYDSHRKPTMVRVVVHGRAHPVSATLYL